jgi:Mor family transcriptional regulator
MRRKIFKKKNRLFKFIRGILDVLGKGFVYRSPKRKEIRDPQLEEIYRGMTARELAKRAKCSHTNSKSYLIKRLLNS